MAEVVLHIGLHKTATGTLQRQFFPACEDLNLLTTKIAEMRDFVTRVTRTDPIYFDSAASLKLLQPVLSTSVTNLLSNESFSGPPYAGAIEKGLDHRSPVLDNLCKVFPQARIVVVLRRQDALVRSFYRQYLKSGGTENIRRVFGGSGDDRMPLIPKDRFRFLPYVDALNEYFTGGVLVLAFEEFVSDQAGFLDKLAQFIGIRKPNIELRVENATRMGPAGMEFTRLLNYVFRGMINRGPLPGIPIYQGGNWHARSPVRLLHDHWPQIWRGKIGNAMQMISKEVLDRLRAENRLLDEKYGLGLKRFGYY